MKNFILSAVALAFAGVSMTEAKTSSFNTSFSLQDTVKKDTVTTPTDTTKKEEDKNGFVMVQSTSSDQEPKTAPAQEQQQEQEPAKAESKTEVALNDLPDAVKKTLTADVFTEWVPTTAYHVTGDTEHYLIEVKKGEELRSIKIGADGKVIN